MKRIITFGISKARNELGEIVGWIEGVTFSEEDRPYLHAMHEYEFFWDGDEYDPPVRIMAIDAHAAYAIFEHHYRVEMCAGLVMSQRIVKYKRIPLPLSEFEG